MSRTGSSAFQGTDAKDMIEVQVRTCTSIEDLYVAFMFRDDITAVQRMFFGGGPVRV